MPLLERWRLDRLRMWWPVAVVAAAALAAGCGDDEPASGAAGTTPAAPAGAEQLESGKALYAAQCASCHDSPTVPGLDGQGPTPIDLSRYTNAASLSDYIAQYMPKGNPAACDSVCADAITAFIRNRYTGAPADDSTGTFTPLSSASALRKVKGVLTGMAPTAAELAGGIGKETLQARIDAWMETPAFQEKMLVFFSNTFQQSSFSLADFQNQLRNRPGALNLPYGLHGDTAFPQLMKNVKESFARTALAHAQSGQSMADLLTTDRFMMTTALKSLYMQIEAANDRASDATVMKWKFNYGRRPALSASLDPSSSDYMVFGHESPATVTGSRTFTDTCNGNSSLVAEFPGNVYLFHLLLGGVNRDTGAGPGLTGTGCWERGTKPYFTASDLSDWQMVQVVKGARIEPWDLPKLRASAGTLPSAAPRVSFFTTPAFLATWNTNDSNSHRVTVNQALLAALGQGFSSATQSIPVPPDTAAIDDEHAVTTSECYACHKSLDPMRQFFQLWFYDNDTPKPAASAGMGAQPGFGFGNVTGSGSTLVDFGNFIKQVTDTQVAGDPVNRFALEMTQKLCYFANSSGCDETDPEMRRVAKVFQDSNHNFKRLVRELFASPLVTSLAVTQTWQVKGATISITRRDQFCQGLSNRLNVADVCQMALPTPARPTRLATLAGALPYDTFSRGVAEPVTPADPNVFYRSAGEMLCEAIAAQVVDSGTGAVFASTEPDVAVEALVSQVMALPPADARHTAAAVILKDHFTAAVKSGASATNAMRSTFSAACLAPSALGQGI